MKQSIECTFGKEYDVAIDKWGKIE